MADLAAYYASLPPRPRPAQSSSVGVVAKLSGEAVVTHATIAEPALLKLDDAVFLKDRIETREFAVVRVLFGGRFIVTVREYSVLTVSDDPAHPRVELQSGKLALKVLKGGIRAGESVEIRTPNAIVGIRGSLVVAEVTGTPSQPDSDITVLEASHTITVAPRSNPTKTTPLRPNETVRVSGHPAQAHVHPVRAITREHARSLANAIEVPGHPRDGGEERRSRRTTARADGHREAELSRHPESSHFRRQ
jgi:hypothetical protein